MGSLTVRIHWSLASLSASRSTQMTFGRSKCGCHAKRRWLVPTRGTRSEIDVGRRGGAGGDLTFRLSLAGVDLSEQEVDEPAQRVVFVLRRLGVHIEYLVRRDVGCPAGRSGPRRG